MTVKVISSEIVMSLNQEYLVYFRREKERRNETRSASLKPGTRSDPLSISVPSDPLDYLWVVHAPESSFFLSKDPPQSPLISSFH